MHISNIAAYIVISTILYKVHKYIAYNTYYILLVYHYVTYTIYITNIQISNIVILLYYTNML